MASEHLFLVRPGTLNGGALIFWEMAGISQEEGMAPVKSLSMLGQATFM